MIKITYLWIQLLQQFLLVLGSSLQPPPLAKRRLPCRELLHRPSPSPSVSLEHQSCSGTSISSLQSGARAQAGQVVLSVHISNSPSNIDLHDPYYKPPQGLHSLLSPCCCHTSLLELSQVLNVLAFFSPSLLLAESCLASCLSIAVTSQTALL